MTSDQGTSGGAELQLGSNLVTPKSHGLNPNANIFQSKTPAAAAAAPAEPPHWEGEDTATPPMDTDGYSYMNGDVATKVIPGADVSSVMVAPPAAAMVQMMKTEIMNGAVETSDLMVHTTNEATAGMTSPVSPAMAAIPMSPAATGTLPADMVANTSDYSGATSPPLPSSSSTALPTSPLSPGDPLDGTIPSDQLRTMLKEQLEYYFSRDNLASDSYLVSQMDGDQYVPIATIASFNLVKRLTTNLELIVDVLRDSSHVQVDEKGEKVRPLHKRCIVILREIPDSTPLEDVKNLFSGKNCPNFVSCEFAHNNSWYVTFDSDEDAQRAYRYLREEIQIFLGRPIMARIKAKPLLRSTFMPKNGFKPQYVAGAGNQAPVPYSNQPSPQSTFTTATSYTPSIPSVQYINSQPQQVPPRLEHNNMAPSIQSQPRQSFPFYQPNTVLPAWPPTSPPFFDPGMVSTSNVFHVNGYQPQGTFKLNQPPSRHGYQNIRNRYNRMISFMTRNTNFRNQNSKPHNRNQNNVMERNSVDGGRLESGRPVSAHERERHSSVPMHRSSPRMSEISHNVVEQSQVQGQGRKSSSSNQTYHSPTNSQSHTPPAMPVQESNVPPMNPRHSREPRDAEPPLVKDQASQQNRSAFKSRRRREEDGAKNTRQSSSQTLSKESGKPLAGSPKFELESTSFPPLPGSTNNATTGDVFENKMSDVVKGTAKPLTRETTKPAVAQSPQKDTTIAPSSSAPTPSTGSVTPASPPLSPKKIESKVEKSSSAPLESSSSNKHEASPAVTAEKKVTASTTTSSPGNVTTPTNTTSATSQPTKQPQQHSHHSRDSHSSTKDHKEQTSKSTPKQLPAHDKEEEKRAPSSEPARLTYAQMLARKGAASGGAASPPEEDLKDSNDAKPQALKEQSQISSKPGSASVSKAPSKGGDLTRKDRNDPKEQRVMGRRAKENRAERREKDKRQDRPRSPTK
ncbi:la-related protein 4-like isoform X2 [Lineus longissimus]|uniref:la-related protein 4-like isoform X2 n=1 Tax=Lineus longissimus TaxID=88925 RepID=UPI00315D7FE6